ARRPRPFGRDEPPAGGASPFYPPLPFLLALPLAAVRADVRLVNVVADLLAALVLFWAPWRRGAPLVGALAATLYLNLPRVPFLIEHAWYEPVIAALLGGGLLLAEPGRWPGDPLLGFGLTAKRSGLPLLLPLLPARWRSWPALLLGLVVAGLLFVPFLLWDAPAFVDVVLVKHLQRPVMPDSITLAAGLHNLCGLTLSWRERLGIAVAGIAWIAWRTPRNGVPPALWMGAALLVFCLCHTQGYFHYFYPF